MSPGCHMTPATVPRTLLSYYFVVSSLLSALSSYNYSNTIHTKLIAIFVSLLGTLVAPGFVAPYYLIFKLQCFVWAYVPLFSAFVHNCTFCGPSRQEHLETPLDFGPILLIIRLCLLWLKSNLLHLVTIFQHITHVANFHMYMAQGHVYAPAICG